MLKMYLTDHIHMSALPLIKIWMQFDWVKRSCEDTFTRSRYGLILQYFFDAILHDTVFFFFFTIKKKKCTIFFILPHTYILLTLLVK